MAYTPQLNKSSSEILRRIAWALNQPMTKTMNVIFLNLPKHIDKKTVCKYCKDPSACDTCGFNGNDAA